MAKEVIVTIAKKNTIGRFVLISWINLRMSVLTNRDVIGGGDGAESPSESQPAASEGDGGIANS